jgi:membrane-bound metal-dependent hydrolase YbcI (DUF457 family)
MANYKGHLVGGLISTGLYAVSVSFLPVERFAEHAGVLQDWQAVFGVFIVGMLFSILPDVDTNSKAQDIFFGIVFPLNIILLWQDMLQASAYLGLIAMLPIIGHHRGWTHKKWAVFVVPLPILIIPYLYNDKILPISIIFFGAAITGYFSHLFLDGLIIKSFRIKN